MIEIISGPTKRDRKEFTCFRCGTIYQADKWDYEFWDPNGNQGYRCACPTCGDNTWHRQTKKDRYGESIGPYEGVKDVEI